MTYRRVLNRNDLADGDYETLPSAFTIVNMNPIGPDGIDRSADLAPYWRKQCEAYASHMRRLCGDLRRLERDAVDENAICGHIEQRTAVPAEQVALVLKEFMDW